MANVQPITELSLIKPFKSGWRIQVKIIHTWKQYTNYNGETLEMVLADKMGTLIHATIKKQQLCKFQPLIVPGEWRIIENFTLTKAMGKFRVTKHVYRMSLMNTSTIIACAPLSDDIYLDLVGFEGVLNDPSLNENILVDVIGQVVNVGEMVTHEVENKLKKKVEFELRDTRDQRLVCTLWGAYAENILAACENNRQKMVICLLRFAKVNSFKGERSVSNAFDMSLLVTDPVLSAIPEFQAKLPKDGLALTIKQAGPKENKEDKKNKKAEIYKFFPTKTIAELLEYNEEGKFKIMCTVYAIDTEYARYYFVCLKCNKPAYKVPKVENEVVKKDKKPLFWCTRCQTTHSKVEPRYKLILCVMDSTAQTKCLLWENDANNILHVSSLELLDGHFDEIQDPTNIPQEMNNLVGKTYQFVVSVEKDNIRDGSDTFKVVHIFNGLDVDQDGTNEQSIADKDLATIVSGNEELAVFSNSNEVCDGFVTTSSTPSSKRKDDVSEDSSDQSSSSKKVCLGSIALAIADEHVADGANEKR